VERCRAGDELAWEAFVREFQRRVYSIASSYVHNVDDARDVAQDIFVRLYEKRRLWPAADIFVPWLIRTSRNVCVDHLRKVGARPAAAESSEELLAMLPSGDRDPESRWEAGSARDAVWRALRRLTSLNREIIVLRDIQGLSLEEVASVLKVPIGTIKSRSNRARLDLARKLADLGWRRDSAGVNRSAGL
jgi:RNA polymerase sigma-70 factor (ECF subfamily)